MITLKITEWEMMVLRAALENHAKATKSDKHRDTARAILAKSRAQDKVANDMLAKL